MPLCIDLFCGLGGWSDGFLAEGWDCIGFDIERHDYGRGVYPGRLVLADVLGLWGSQFSKADCIVASPPCQTYSYMAMPWSRAKTLAAWYREHELRQVQLNALFNACFRIQREACAAAGRHIPMVVENVKGAQPWVGAARAHFGSFYFWGDIGMVGNQIVAGNASFGGFVRAAKRGAGGKRNPDGTEHPQGSWFAIADSKSRGANGQKVEGFNFHHFEKTGQPGGSFQSAAVGSKGFVTGLGKGHDWRQDPSGRYNSKSAKRKAASAEIAKIPFPLASYVARALKPRAPL